MMNTGTPITFLFYEVTGCSLIVIHLSMCLLLTDRKTFIIFCHTKKDSKNLTNETN